MSRVGRAALAGLLVGLLLVGAARADEPPDLIVHHAKVVTVDAKFSVAEAVAVKGDRIVAVGTNDDVLKLAGPQTEKVDAGGKMVLPGLTDSHVHATGAAMHEFDHPIPEMDTMDDLLKYIAGRTRVVKEGDWISISQVFITRLRASTNSASARNSSACWSTHWRP